jgi:diaminohydroxyphosphoribosylaminopyrimidine deaminase/5-amino-6-(5-phosphoribosylamino)uracil reductase
MSAHSFETLHRNALRGFGLTTVGAAGSAAVLALLLGGSPVGFALKAVLVPVALWALVRPSLARHLPHTVLGPANAVTLARSLAVAWMAALVGFPGASAWPGLVVLFAGVAIVLDGVDGLVARRSRMSTEFGASVDGELDALLVLVLSVAIWQVDRSGIWILAAGSARFVFLAAMRVWPWLSAPLPFSNHRKLCFGFFVWAMVVVPMPWVSWDAAHLLSFFATVLLLLSFAVDVVWLRALAKGETASREDLPPAVPGEHAWGRILRSAHDGSPLVHTSDPADQALVERFSPLLARSPDRPFVIGHLAQSLDGHIALDCGASQWISGPDDIVHTHRLRAIVDAVLVGVETALRDNPRLTVREVDGPNPLRVVLDPKGRLKPDSFLCTDTDADTLILTTSAHVPAAGLLGRARVRVVPDEEGFVPPREVLAVLAEEGVRRVLVEGGGVTVSEFVRAGLMDRLHLMVAPVLLGSGRPALHLPAAGDLGDALRPTCRVETVGADVLFDIDFRPTDDAEAVQAAR